MLRAQEPILLEDTPSVCGDTKAPGATRTAGDQGRWPPLDSSCGLAFPVPNQPHKKGCHVHSWSGRSDAGTGWSLAWRVAAGRGAREDTAVPCHSQDPPWVDRTGTRVQRGGPGGRRAPLSTRSLGTAHPKHRSKGRHGTARYQRVPRALHEVLTP